VGDKNVIQNFEYQLQLPCTPSVLIFCSSMYHIELKFLLVSVLHSYMHIKPGRREYKYVVGVYISMNYNV
jgi:hypothetical protein